ncbi:MAG: helix-turn-helix transcriptional regulator [Pseudomonadota bacterium]
MYPCLHSIPSRPRAPSKTAACQVMAAKPVIQAMTQSLLSVRSEIRQLRKARQMTLKDLSQASFVSLSHLSAIGRGKARPSMDALGNAADALSVTPDFFARCTTAGPTE